MATAWRLFTPSLSLLYLGCFFNFLAIALVLVSTVSLICERIGGSPTSVNAQTSFVTTTSYFIMMISKLMFAKYDTAMSDYIGRKPVLVLSSFGFILSRTIVLQAQRGVPAFFYLGAFVVGAFDVFYAVSVSYLSDICSEHLTEERGKAIGIQTGLSVGMGFTIGVPVGAVLQELYSIETPFYLAIAVSFLAIICVLAIPFPDTRGIVNNDKARRFPVDWRAFLIEHSPLSGFGLIQKAASRLDWMTNYCGQVAQQLLQSVFLLFVQSALGYSPAQAGIAFACIGLSIAAFSPTLISRYEERGLISAGMAVQIGGYALLSLSCLGGASKFLAFPSFLFLAAGSVWMSAMPSILTKQYLSVEYGAVTGVMAQQQVLAVLPAYPISLLFSYTLSQDSKLHWSGIIWFFSACFLLGGIFVQCLANPGRAALTLVRRRQPTTAPVTGSEDDELVSVGEKTQAAVVIEDSIPTPTDTINPMFATDSEAKN